MMIEFTVNWPIILGLVISTILPIIVGLVTKFTTNPSFKAILLAVISGITGLLTELLNAITSGQVYNLAMGLVFAFIAIITAVVFHFGIWRPTGVTAAAQKVGDHAA